MPPAKDYTEMKDSGIDIIGKIPTHWNLCRLRFLCRITTGNQDTQNAVEDGIYPFYVRSPKIERANSYTFDGESVLMAGDGAGAGKVFHHAFGKYAIHQRVYCFFDFKNIVPRYFYYFVSNLFSSEIDKGSAKSTVASVRLPMLQNFILCLPTTKEQTYIAAYLDTQCAKIDEIIAQAKASIEDYKQWKVSIIHKAVTKGMGNNRPMKDSGILWIKKIPESWSVRKLKFAIFPLERPVLNTDEVITCFRDGEVTMRKNRRTDGFTVSFTEHGYQGVEKGDLVIHGMDAFAGAIGCSDCRGKTTPVVHVCKTIGNNRYFMYALRNMALSNVFTDFSNGVRIRSSDFRNFSKLGDFLIAIPPITEQGEIVDYLDSMTSKIDMLVTEKQRLLDEMESYKKSLIYEVVTGKRRVC